MPRIRRREFLELGAVLAASRGLPHGRPRKVRHATINVPPMSANVYIGRATLPVGDWHQAMIDTFVAAGKARYVAVPGSGSDGNTGTAASPYATVEKLIKSLQIDELGIIAPGVRTEASPGSGAPYLALISGTSNGSSLAHPVKITNQHNGVVELRNGSVRGAGGWDGVHFIGQHPDYFKLNGWRSSGAEPTIWWYGDDFLAENLDISHYDLSNPTANTGDVSATFLGNPTGPVRAQRPIFRACRVHDVHWDASGNQPHGCYCDYSQDAIWEDCIIYNIRSAAAIDNSYGFQNGPSAQNTIFRYCIIYHVDGGVTCWGSGSSVEVHHCTFVDYQTPGAVRCASGNTMNLHDCHSDGTLIHPSSTGITNGGGHTTGDPLFADPANRIFLPLGAGSPAAGKVPRTDWG